MTIAGTRVRIRLPYIEQGSWLHVGLHSALSDIGDGFRGLVSLERDGNTTPLIERYIYSARNTQDRGWIDYHLNLTPHAGSNNYLILECRSGPAGQTQGDWLAWSILKINKRKTS